MNSAKTIYTLLTNNYRTTATLELANQPIDDEIRRIEIAIRVNAQLLKNLPNIVASESSTAGRIYWRNLYRREREITRQLQERKRNWQAFSEQILISHCVADFQPIGQACGICQLCLAPQEL